MNVLSVSEYIELTNAALAQAAEGLEFEVEGEVASFGISGGQWVRFDLKDGEGLINCFMTAWQLKEQIADGMKIAVTGYAKIYPKYGKLSFVVKSLRLSGEGSLKRAFEMLQKKLQAEGLFDVSRKRTLPRFPERIALITSRDAAAFTDFLRVSGARWPMTVIDHYHVAVQGASGAADVVQAVQTAGAQTELYDVIVVVRGGGSIEDLHVFNTEEVARAVFSSRVPVVSGVGHERDVTIIDMVADVRAATPSNAAELIFPDQREILQTLATSAASITRGMEHSIASQMARVAHITTAADLWVRRLRDSVQGAVRLLAQRRDLFEHRLIQMKDSVAFARRTLETLHPRTMLARGYSYSKAPDGTIITKASQARAQKNIVQVYADGEVPMIVQDI